MEKLSMNIFKTVIFTCVSVVIFGVVTPVFAQEPWVINSFESEINVQENGSLLVEEHITVEFDEERHGIFREIPVWYEDAFNNNIKTGIKILEVSQDGEKAMIDESSDGINLIVRIGDPDEYIMGIHEYVISYRVKHAILFFDDYDEIYWNATGSKWPVPVLKSSAVVILPDGAEMFDTSCYVGPKGSTSQDCGIATDENSAAFAAEDFLTVAVGFEKGFVDRPSIFYKIIMFLWWNSLLLIPLFIIIFVISYWWKVGKDPIVGTVVAEYEPPQDIWAAYAGILVKDSVSSSDITAMIIQMATKGYLIIETKKDHKNKNNTFLIKKKVDNGLDNAHKQLFSELFKSGDRVSVKDLKGKIAEETMNNIKKSLKDKLVLDGIYVEYSFKRRAVMSFIGGALIWIGIAINMMYIYGMIIGVLCIIAGIVTMITAIYMPKKSIRGAELMRKVKGFKLFMHTAERYRSEWQEREYIFAEYLPYAIAFNDTKHWAKVFKNIEGIENPSWYQSDLPISTITDFVNVMGGVSTSISTSVRRVPSSSGSRGGGFSGGGFGGGGGGSW